MRVMLWGPPGRPRSQAQGPAFPQALSPLQSPELKAQGWGFKALKLGGGGVHAHSDSPGLVSLRSWAPLCPPGCSSSPRFPSVPSRSQRCLPEATTKSWGHIYAGPFGVWDPTA